MIFNRHNWIPVIMFLCKLEWNQSQNSTVFSPSVSIILFTNRPGAIDMAFYSLAQQSSRDYELIVVDDSDGDRRSSMIEFADSLNINLQHIIRSKRKTSAVSARGGEANAMNTGLLLARGHAAVFLNDFTWLPQNFVADTAEVCSRDSNQRCTRGRISQARHQAVLEIYRLRRAD